MKNESLPKNIIIKHRHDFERLFKSGKRKNGRYVRMIYLSLENSLSVGFLCPKKTGNAVHRNLYKRRMREIFRKHKEAFQDIEVIFMALPSIRGASFQDLKEDMIILSDKLRR